ncbi:MAG: hypothetical protein OEM41_00180 [Ignavibacteria bacterium]|nr:hypothetical protein [Ignavibacteria bacterium]
MVRLHMLTVLIISFSYPLFAQVTPTTTVGGYGELHYNEPDGRTRGQLDFHRFVVYLSHTFASDISLYSEVELEHTRIEAGEDDGGEISIEQAFLDYRLSTSIGVRAGILLTPVGLINLYHEPPTFHGVERPNVDRVIIPSTWSEAGAGVYGMLTDGLQYQAYIIAGLDAAGFSAGSGLRGGRQLGYRSNPANPSLTGRLDYTPVLGLQLGGSFFIGGSAGGNDSLGSATVAMWSGDIRYATRDLSLRAVGAIATIGDAEKINAVYRGAVADRIFGYYVEAAYNILPLLAPDSEQELFVFGRFEKYNTQAATTGFAALQQFNRNDIVLGVTYKPTYNTALKCDYTFLKNNLNAGSATNTKQLNIGLGYFFY